MIKEVLYSYAVISLIKVFFFFGACLSKVAKGCILIHDNQGSNINEVIRSLFIVFFTIRFHKYKKAQNIIKTIQFFNRSHYSMFRSYVSKYIYYFSGTSVIKIILIFNWVLIN